MNDSIKMGDTVRLRSGGPLMTVGVIVTAEEAAKEDADAIEGAATCSWFETLRPHGNAHASAADPVYGSAQAGVFHVDMLDKVPTATLEVANPFGPGKASRKRL